MSRNVRIKIKKNNNNNNSSQRELGPPVPRRTPFVLNCLRDTACKYFLAFNSALFYSLRICFLYIFIFKTTFSYSF